MLAIFDWSATKHLSKAKIPTALGSYMLFIPCIPANGLNPAKPYNEPSALHEASRYKLETHMVHVLHRVYRVARDVQPSPHLR